MNVKLNDDEHDLIHWIDENDEFADKFMKCNECESYLNVNNECINELILIKNRWFCKTIKNEINKLIERIRSEYNNET